MVDGIGVVETDQELLPRADLRRRPAPAHHLRHFRHRLSHADQVHDLRIASER